MPDSADDISFLLDSLNDAQREAVAAPAAHTLVLAGAGSGKTRVLIHRIAWLMRVENVSSYSILSVTFTNKAAKEMHNRLHQLLNITTQSMWVGTFHGLTHRLLRIHHQEAGLPEGFQILDSEDQYRMVKRTIKQLELDEKKWPPRQIQWYINQQKDQGYRPKDIPVDNDKHAQTLRDIYHLYEQQCQRGGLVDFAELLLRCYELWLQKPEILQHYQQRFQHVLVDEFQDINTIQYKWLQVLAQHNHVFAVGDDDQSIYAWRGAKITHLQQFQQDFVPNQLFKLEQNYRSTGTILAAANALIQHNSERLGKNLWTQGNDGEPIYLFNAYNDLDEARFITSKIQTWHEEQGHYQDCAILYRSNAQSRVIEEALLRENMPYRIYGGLRFYERAEIKDSLAYLRLVANQDDDSALERVVNLPPRGIGSRSVESLRSVARRSNCSLWQAMGLLIAENTMPARGLNAFKKFQFIIDELTETTRDMSLDQLCQHMLEDSGLLAFYQKKTSEKDQMRVENLEELVRACRQFIYDSGEGLSPLNAFLTHSALEAGESGQGHAGDSVQLMTLHTAKGLEFPLVFLCGLEEQLFPHKMALTDPNGLEEERRLCYVGITRARQLLYLSYAEVRRLHGSETYSRPSRFINEIPIELIEQVRLNVTSSQAVYTPPKKEQAEQTYQIGDQVLHDTFGTGWITASEGSGNAARVQVDFGLQGSKWLVLAYARLQKVD